MFNINDSNSFGNKKVLTESEAVIKMKEENTKLNERFLEKGKTSFNNLLKFEGRKDPWKFQEMKEQYGTELAYKTAILMENQVLKTLKESDPAVMSTDFVDGKLKRLLGLIKLSTPLQRIVGEVIKDIALDFNNNYIYRIKQNYANTKRGVTADEYIVTSGDYTYTGEVNTVSLGVGNGANVTFTGSGLTVPIVANTARILIKDVSTGLNARVISADNGANGFANTTVLNSISSVIDYSAGTVTVVFNGGYIPTSTEEVFIEYSYSTEYSANYDEIGEINFSLEQIPIPIRAFNLKTTLNIFAQYAMSGIEASFNLEDELLKEAAAVLALQRDYYAANEIVTTARYRVPSSTVYKYNADFAVSGSDDPNAWINNFEGYIMKEATRIYELNNRGGINKMLVGPQAGLYISRMAKFTSANEPKVGIYKIGTLNAAGENIEVYVLPKYINTNEIVTLWNNPTSEYDMSFISGTQVPFYSTQTLEYYTTVKEKGFLALGGFKAINPDYVGRLEISNISNM